MCCIFLYMPKKDNFEAKKSILTTLLSSSSLLPKQISLKKVILHHFSAMGPCLFLLEHLLCLSHRKTRWTMSVDNVGVKICIFGDFKLHGHSNTIFPWCKLKCFWDVLNIQSNILHGLGTTSWSMV